MTTIIAYMDEFSDLSKRLEGLASNLLALTNREKDKPLSVRYRFKRAAVKEITEIRMKLSGLTPSPHTRNNRDGIDFGLIFIQQGIEKIEHREPWAYTRFWGAGLLLKEMADFILDLGRSPLYTADPPSDEYSEQRVLQ